MATFPSYAKVLLAGFTEEPDYGVLRTQMDDGLAKQRPRRSKPIVTRDVQIYVQDASDKASFDGWIATDLNGGTGWFTWTDPLDSTAKQARIVGGKYRWSSPGRAWIAECHIETIG